MNTIIRTDYRKKAVAVLRKKRLTVNLTEAEYRLVKESAAKAGLGIALYIKEMTLKGYVQARLNEEERSFFKEAVGLSNDLHQLVQLARSEGITSILPVFESYRNRIDKSLNQMHL
ncbi:plasmid mobilization protein [Puia dinghuensis]|uniref:Plasmid mobilization relaxosome protein MobC n=1 Tax=Puia dinghuensis TaxID=1792502 RepID=A0A8J2U9Q3_9BACT|nr:hypothetical protein [Puia dinghuensis]GGA89173.1 hypothetical protein GCM10011511_10500 [Puia dinghuensis]